MYTLLVISMLSVKCGKFTKTSALDTMSLLFSCTAAVTFIPSLHSIKSLSKSHDIIEDGEAIIEHFDFEILEQNSDIVALGVHFVFGTGPSTGNNVILKAQDRVITAAEQHLITNLNDNLVH